MLYSTSHPHNVRHIILHNHLQNKTDFILYVLKYPTRHAGAQHYRTPRAARHGDCHNSLTKAQPSLITHNNRANTELTTQPLPHASYWCHLYEAGRDRLQHEVVPRRRHVLQSALHDVVAVGVERQLHHARAKRARDHRRLSIRAAQLRYNNTTHRRTSPHRPGKVRTQHTTHTHTHTKGHCTAFAISPCSGRGVWNALRRPKVLMYPATR